MARSEQVREKASPKLRYRLFADKSYSAGKPITLGFRLENLTNKGLLILTWYTPLEGIKSRIFKVTCGGKEILYNGPMVKRAAPALEDYVRIGPKASISAKVDLSQAYSLPICSECLVEFEGRIHDIVHEDGTSQIEQGSQHGMDIMGNAASFRVVAPQ
jgi:hypothetical protein